MKKGKIYIGTSGWSYRHWKGRFYPQGVRAAEEFDFYSLFFDTVELNNPFYRLPSKQTFESWYEKSKDGFLYVVKASRFITHMKKLKDVKAALDLFLDHCNLLREKLGPILFQLPPGWLLNKDRLREFLAQLPQGYRFVFEFRNPSWYTEEVYQLLEKYNCAFCIYQLAGHMSPMVTTAGWVYIRLHGPTKNKYQGSYDFRTLREWASRCIEWRRSGKDVYVYFDNDDSGYAAFNAQVLEMLVNKDAPITEHEAEVLAFMISAIKKQRPVRFYYESESGNYERAVDPYLIAIKNVGTRRGAGNIFFTGYKYPDPKHKSDDKEDRQGHYLLGKIDLRKTKMLRRIFNDIKIEDEKVFGNFRKVRAVYRTGLRPKKS
jgi:uncharacterized protein YecE (DUF72 family)